MTAPTAGDQMGSDALAQAIAQAHLLGGIQATLLGVERSSSETLQIVRGQETRIGKVEANDGIQDARLAGHDREFGEIRGSLDAISAKLDARGLTWPKLLAGGAALAAILGVAISAIVAMSNGLSYLASIAERVGS